MPKQIPLEVTQGTHSPDNPPIYAPEDLPVEQRGGVPEEVWRQNLANASDQVMEEKPKADQKKKAPAESQPDVPDDFTKQEQKKAAELGKAKLESEKEAGRA